jgi:alcohol dehydrogenase (cytochrome c)
MRRRRRFFTAAGAASAALAALALLPAAGAATSPATAAGSQNLNWRYYGDDLANTRYQNVDQINPSNVAGLEPAWVFRTGISNRQEVSPIVVDGIMYITDGQDDVFALDAATGAEKWAYHPVLPPAGQLPIGPGLQVNRGVADGDGMVFVAQLDGKLVALNAHTGTVAWVRTVASYQNQFWMSMAPQYVDGEVIVGTSGADVEAPCFVAAYSAGDGQPLWTFETTPPGPTWAGDSWKTGGGSVWNTPAADPRLGLIYVDVGNPGPDLLGVNRAGKNLYTDSIVALDLRTGKLRWYYQEVHHDLWDYDSAQAVMLFSVTLNGHTYPALGEGNKDGQYFILNRVTGQPLFPVQEMPVPTGPSWQHAWPTQPVSAVQPVTPLTVGPLPSGYTAAPQFTSPQPETLVEQPGADGGMQWTSAAYSPRTADVYYGTGHAPVAYQATPTSTSPLGSTYTADLPAPTQYYTVIGATSTITGKVVWKTAAPLGLSSVAVAGDLLFYGTADMQFHAVNAATGAPLWTFNGADAGVPIAPASIYTVDGREYVVEAFGGLKSSLSGAVIAFALPSQ